MQCPRLLWLKLLHSAGTKCAPFSWRHMGRGWISCLNWGPSLSEQMQTFSKSSYCDGKREANRECGDRKWTACSDSKLIEVLHVLIINNPWWFPVLISALTSTLQNTSDLGMNVLGHATHFSSFSQDLICINFSFLYCASRHKYRACLCIYYRPVSYILGSYFQNRILRKVKIRQQSLGE